MRYTIWQRPVNDPLCFSHYQPEEIDLGSFCSIWTGIVADGDIINTLEELFVEFNTNHPAHYAGRSLSVGDLVKLGNEFYLCEATGWKKVKVKD